MTADPFAWNGEEVSVGRVAEHLRAEGFYVSMLASSWSCLVQAPPQYPGVPAGVSFLLWDNGGELGVERINSGEQARFAPTTAWGIPVGPMTMLVRVLCLLRGEEIDYETNLDPWECRADR